jgi:hypothetical protein
MCWMLAGIVWLSWTRDNERLRQQAEMITRGLSKASDKITAVSHWVNRNQGFAPNRQHFLIESLGPTSIQVLEAGGDCADKSRLVSAMLRQLGVASGLVMLRAGPASAPIHTVVEAAAESGRMVVDPTWDVDYPGSDGRYLGIRDLAATPRGRNRVLELQKARGPDAKIAKMSLAEATFDYAEAVNWNRNSLTRAAFTTLSLLGADPSVMFRPRLLEDPKLAVASCLLLLGCGPLAVGYAVTPHRVAS